MQPSLMDHLCKPEHTFTIPLLKAIIALKTAQRENLLRSITSKIRIYTQNKTHEHFSTTYLGILSVRGGRTEVYVYGLPFHVEIGSSGGYRFI